MMINPNKVATCSNRICQLVDILVDPDFFHDEFSVFFFSQVFFSLRLIVNLQALAMPYIAATTRPQPDAVPWSLRWLLRCRNVKPRREAGNLSKLSEFRRG